MEERYAADPPSANTSGIGYLLEQRVADVEEYADCLRRVAAGGTAPDPQGTRSCRRVATAIRWTGSPRESARPWS